jgi:hypothetical protein
MAVSLPKGQGAERLRDSESSLQEFRSNVRFASALPGWRRHELSLIIILINLP